MRVRRESAAVSAIFLMMVGANLGLFLCFASLGAMAVPMLLPSLTPSAIAVWLRARRIATAGQMLPWLLFLSLPIHLGMISVIWKVATGGR